MMPSPTVQGQKGYLVLEVGLEKLDAVRLHINLQNMLHAVTRKVYEL